MKKIILTIVLSFSLTMAFSQDNKIAQRFKYITEAPDGSIAMTIYDDTREDNMKLESAEDFYRYEIIEPTTSETMYSAPNEGKKCTIDKNKLKVGTYDLRLFTSNFIITSKITITATRNMYASFKHSIKSVASRE